MDAGVGHEVKGLEVVRRLYTTTSNGQREIQLCIGDITALPIQEKVDVILVSALPGNYVPNRRSVIGALYRNLGLSVEKLSRKIKEDLRETCHCWISNELPEDLPYRQLICSEIPRGKHPRLEERVSNIFRAMMPVFNNENKSVITPLIGTRMQDSPRTKMLHLLVMTAIEWMHMGLTLQCLKLVVYAPGANDLEVDDCKAVFDKLLGNIEQLEAQLRIKKPQLVTDIFLVYEKEEKALKEQICHRFRERRENIVIKSLYQMTKKEDSWQYDIYQEMLTSKRVVLLLTIDFLQSETCVDAFNVALCVNRLCRRSLLAPIFLEQCNLPQYMAMVQWINCKPRDTPKIEHAIGFLTEDIGKGSQSENVSYDIFLSYCHRDLEEAKQVLAKLQQANPGLTIFFDYDELRTGESWQQKLYNSISRSSCVVALVSPNYLSSAVCQEEFGLALAQHLAKKKTTELIPVLIKPTDDIYFSSEVNPVSAFESNFQAKVTEVSNDIVRWLRSGIKSDIFSPAAVPLDFHDIAERSRQLCIENHYDASGSRMINAGGAEENSTPAPPPKSVTVHLSFVPSTQNYVTFVEKMLQRQQRETAFTFQSAIYGNMGGPGIPPISVVFLSEDYARCDKEIEELTVLLGQWRSSKDPRILYVVVVSRLSSNPLYLHLIPTQTNLLDSFWELPFADDEKRQNERSQVLARLAQGLVTPDVSPDESVKVREELRNEAHAPLTDVEVLGLKKVVCDILSVVNGNGLPGDSHGESVIFNVVKAKKSMNTISRDHSSSEPLISPAVITQDSQPFACEEDFDPAELMGHQAMMESNITQSNAETEEPKGQGAIASYHVQDKKQNASAACSII